MNEEDRGFESLNMIPFIDIMLVLLTIVLTTSSFIASGRIAVNLPTASAEPVQEKETEIVEIDAAGAIFHGGQALTLPQLRERFAPLSRETPILLRADKTIPLQGFVDVADLLKRLGFSRLALQTDTRGGG
ncbi:MAG: biopolymer transporter ExbD [Candidatus Accumulibacter sp.]|jgi:biopolymer transport protein ExbD|nr:biopolymer transporter ExbD [Accumulibacter sp.]